MKRSLYRAQVEDGNKELFVVVLEEARQAWRRELMRQGALACSLFAKDESLFLYLESEGECFKWEWPDACKEMLETWPGDSGVRRYAVPMLDIYHDGEPEPSSARRDGQTACERIGSLARLRPEMYGSYIFYHFALQEEKPGSFNPTYMIGAHETLIFSYQERPAPVGGTVAPRRTWPAAVAPANWHEIMLPHFIPWSDGEQGPVLWEPMNTLFTF